MNEDLIYTKGTHDTKNKRIGDGIDEIVFKGERLYRVYTAPITKNNVPDIATESLFTNLTPEELSVAHGFIEHKRLIIIEPYYDPALPAPKKIITCCHIDKDGVGCEKVAEYSISSGPFTDQVTYACLNHLNDMLDDSQHFNIDKLYPEPEIITEENQTLKTLDKLKELAWKFTTDIEEQHSENTWHLPDSFLPLLHYLRGLDDSWKAKED